jgi:hypothetical protein
MVGPAVNSVPWRLIGQRVEAGSTATAVQLVRNGTVVATHLRAERGRPTRTPRPGPVSADPAGCEPNIRTFVGALVGLGSNIYVPLGCPVTTACTSTTRIAAVLVVVSPGTVPAWPPPFHATVHEIVAVTVNFPWDALEEPVR